MVCQPKLTEGDKDMDKEQFIKSSLEFMEEYKRLPMLKEDDVRLKQDGDEPDRVLRAHTRITDFFGSEDKFIEYLLENKHLTYKTIAEYTGFSETVVSNIINKTVQTPDVKARRAVEVFLGKDLLADSLSPYHSKCDGCKKKCKQWYFVDLQCNAINGYEKK